MTDAQAERLITALEGVRAELVETRKVLETLPDRRDLVETFVASALAVGPQQLTPELIGKAVREVSDAVWAAVHGEGGKDA